VAFTADDNNLGQTVTVTVAGHEQTTCSGPQPGDNYRCPSQLLAARSGTVKGYVNDFRPPCMCSAHSNYRVMLEMYVGTTAGILDRARAATE
jgi:hypothetical protein